jgi:hypothetical protein
MNKDVCETCRSTVEARGRPVQPETSISILLRWVRANVLATLTILGILIYAVFSIPATYFYARLGTTPSEVGVTYSTIVSESTFGLLLLVALSLAALYYLFLIALVAITYSAGFWLLWAIVRHPILRQKDEDLDEEQFKEKLIILQDAFHGTSEIWLEIELDLWRRRDIYGAKQRTLEDVAELRKNRNLRIYARMLWAGYRRARERLTPRSIKAIGTVIILGFAVICIMLTWIARIQSEEVEQGSRVFGTQIGTFDYHAQPVTLHPDSAGDEKILERLAGPLSGPNSMMYLLGQNAQYLIIYSWAENETIRVPVSEATVSSVP